MKLYELTKQDLENIEIKEKIDDELFLKLQIERKNLIRQQSEKYQVDYNKISTSENNKYILRREYSNNNRVFECLFFGGISLIFITLMVLSNIYNGLEISNIPIFIIWLIVSILMIIFGIKSLLIRRKIKNNFKELRLKL